MSGKITPPIVGAVTIHFGLPAVDANDLAEGILEHTLKTSVYR